MSLFVVVQQNRLNYMHYYLLRFNLDKLQCIWAGLIVLLLLCPCVHVHVHGGAV